MQALKSYAGVCCSNDMVVNGEGGDDDYITTSAKYGCDYDGEMGTYDFVSALISESILNRTITSRSSGRAAGGIASFGRSRFFAMEQRLRGAPLNSGVIPHRAEV